MSGNNRIPAPEKTTIMLFRGKHDFLSNFHFVENGIVFDGLTYHTAEAAFQAQKTLNFEEREKIAKCISPSFAKRMGRSVHLRSDWEEIKDTVMESVIRAKFSDPTLRQKLLDTGDKDLIEGNTWGDSYWGYDVLKKTGQNKLGKILKKIRKEIKEEIQV